MYQHSGGGYENGSGSQFNNNDGDYGDGQEQSRSTGATFQPNAAFADFMRNNDPNSNNTSSSSSARTPPPANSRAAGGGAGRGRPGPGGRRLMAATATMPSMRSVVPPSPAEPAMSSGVGSRRISGVAMGTVYEADSQSAGSSRTPQVLPGAPAAAAVGGHGNSHVSPFTSVGSEPAPQPSAHQKVDMSVGSGSAGYLPNAPYQEMLQSFGKEDPTIARARSQMASLRNSKQMDGPFPKAGLPQEPTSQAMEPTIPHSRLGRRILANNTKPMREPTFVIPKVLGNDVISTKEGLQSNNLECTGCHVTLLVAKSAVVMLCPNCDQVQSVANCPVRRPHS